MNPYRRLAHIMTFVSTSIPMASIAFSFCLLTQNNVDNRSRCTHNLVANKSDVRETEYIVGSSAFGKS